MTRKDYIAIAAALYSVRNGYGTNWNPNLFRACDDHAKELAMTLQRDNPRFDRARFLKACGVADQDYLDAMDAANLRQAATERCDD